jgi:hypothetical protein
MATMRKLEDHTAEELRDLNYEDLKYLRRGAYTRAVKSMKKVPKEIKQWVKQQEQAYGPKVRVWFNEMGWLEAYMVVRYGEDPMQWPDTLGEDDVRRIQRWDSSSAAGLKLLPREVDEVDDDTVEEGKE